METTEAFQFTSTFAPKEYDRSMETVFIVLGVLFGVITIIMLVFGFFHFWYFTRHGSYSYTQSCGVNYGSRGSGAANMASFSNQNSSAMTPIDTNNQDPLAELDYHHSAINPGGNNERVQLSHIFSPLDLIPTTVSIVDKPDTPPPYEANIPAVPCQERNPRLPSNDGSTSVQRLRVSQNGSPDQCIVY